MAMSNVVGIAMAGTVPGNGDLVVMIAMMQIRLSFPGQEWFKTADSDSFGGDIAMNSCLKPNGFEDNGDCDDADPMTYPSAQEICDGVVNDCGGGSVPSNETDNDGDGYVECVFDNSGLEWIITGCWWWGLFRF